MTSFVQVRAAATDGDLAAWSAFCAQRGFAHRGGDPGRFLTRFSADVPRSRRRDRVLMAVMPAAEAGGSDGGGGGSGSVPSERVVGSARLLSRLLLPLPPDGAAAHVDSGDAVASLPPPPLRVIGWGEVCSDPELRGRGVAGAVLSRALALTLAARADLALLHAAAPVRGLYEKFGFTAPLCAQHGAAAWADLAVAAMGSPRRAAQAVALRRADLHGDLRELRRLHAHAARALGASGLLAREGQAEAGEEGDDGVGAADEAEAPYWTSWIAHLVGARSEMWVLEAAPEEGGASAARAASADAGAGAIAGALAGAASERSAASTGGRLLAYACTWWREGRLRVCDLGFAPEAGRADVALLLEKVLVRGLLAAGPAPGPGPGPSAAAEPPEQLLVLPLPALAWLRLRGGVGAAGDAKADEALSDRGWMVRPLSAAGERAVEGLVRASERGTFFVWGLDAF